MLDILIFVVKGGLSITFDYVTKKFIEENKDQLICYPSGLPYEHDNKNNEIEGISL